jgi:hypothetical protein
LRSSDLRPRTNTRTMCVGGTADNLRMTTHNSRAATARCRRGSRRPISSRCSASAERRARLARRRFAGVAEPKGGLRRVAGLGFQAAGETSRLVPSNEPSGKTYNEYWRAAGRAMGTLPLSRGIVRNTLNLNAAPHPIGHIRGKRRPTPTRFWSLQQVEVACRRTMARNMRVACEDHSGNSHGVAQPPWLRPPRRPPYGQRDNHANLRGEIGLWREHARWR